MRVLVVVHPFKDFQRGDVIADQAEMEAVLGGEHRDRVVASERPDEAAAAG